MKNATNSILRLIIGSVLAAGVLTACANRNVVHVDCPEIRIPINTDRITRFAPGDGRDITDVALRAEIGFLSGECIVYDEEIQMVFPVAIRGERGPAEDDYVEALSAFLAVANQDRQILSRRQLPFTIRFAGNETEVVNTDIITITIPKVEEQPSREFLVFLGLNLSREEYGFNREESGS